MQIQKASGFSLACSLCNNESQPQNELEEDFVVVPSANIYSMVKDDDWSGHNLEYLKYYDRLHKLCQEASTDDPNCFNVPVCYNCLTRTVQKRLKSDIACAVQESNAYRTAIGVLKIDNEKIPDVDYTEEMQKLGAQNNELVDELLVLINESTELDTLIAQEEAEFKILEEEEKELQFHRNSQMSKKQELNLILLESEKIYESKVQLCELFTIQSTCDEVFHIVNHESYASINGLKLSMDRNISSTQELNAGLGHIATCLYSVIEWLKKTHTNMKWKGFYQKNYTLIPLGSKSYFENNTDYSKIPLYQEQANVVGWISSFITESPFDRAMVIFLNFIFELKHYAEALNPNLFRPIKELMFNKERSAIDYKLEFFYVKVSDGKQDLWAKSFSLLAKILSFFLMWIQEEKTKKYRDSEEARDRSYVGSSGDYDEPK